MKTTTKTKKTAAADLANEMLDSYMTEADKEWWRQVGEDEKRKAGK